MYSKTYMYVGFVYLLHASGLPLNLKGARASRRACLVWRGALVLVHGCAA